MAAANAKPDSKDSVFTLFYGTTPDITETVDTNDIVHIDSSTIMSMSDSDRLDLYNKIIAQVNKKDNTNDTE